ncbi:exopolysaccharide biosynthesis polyprenyl glycosylphosphotransferase [Thermanaeromonas toyohensis ToBE]|uniref:Exopolysaccharide biosynthesis polyprenyl glycosylphosphotransferase n=1 Tax=Thermanaeromonas toyohensis ToBE TaxID=698762 RepID=A0A1W1VY78_9FIRM|nr:sugar transferase [Thermanaeromonas toyohensis]SMB98203.1 exopolysaccharide biosynthesis polyprenyl glycosylphosphotransferase [Thermanaeromonas toyohensis ToBE]
MRWTKVGKVLGDLACVHCGYIAAFLIRFHGSLPEANFKAYLAVAPYLSLAALILLHSYGLFSSQRRRWAEVFSSLVCVVTLLLPIGLSTSYLFQTYAFPRSIFLLAAPFHLFFLILWRRFVWAWSLARQGPLTLLVVGPKEEALMRAKLLQSQEPYLFQVAGVVTDVTLDKGGEGQPDIPWLGTYAELVASLKHAGPKGVLLCSGLPREERAKILKKAVEEDLAIFLIPDLEDIFLAGASLEQIDGIPVFRIPRIQEEAALGWKRLLDIVMGLLLLGPALPVMLLAALALKLENPHWPVFYMQERVGKGGRVFRLIKLRTMIPGAEEETGPTLATPDDPRLTRVGRFLRATRIDELPQLWNVLKGEMSFVGPRPERPYFVEQLKKEIPGYHLRHHLPAGITGLAQVEGRYSTPPEDKLRYDLMYGKSASLLTDLRIILRTLSVIMLRDKAS